MTINEKKKKVEELSHALQTGVAALMNYDGQLTELKQLRVGINMAMVENGALVNLLMNKGIITEDEYFDALISALITELNMYQDQLSRILGGARINLL